MLALTLGTIVLTCFIGYLWLRIRLGEIAQKDECIPRLPQWIRDEFGHTLAQLMTSQSESKALVPWRRTLIVAFLAYMGYLIIVSSEPLLGRIALAGVSSISLARWIYYLDKQIVA